MMRRTVVALVSITLIQAAAFAQQSKTIPLEKFDEFHGMFKKLSGK